MHRELEGSLRRLEQDPEADPREVIRALYHRLLLALRPRLGTLATYTVREVDAVIVSAFGVRAENAHELSALFEEARYSQHLLTGATPTGRGGRSTGSSPTSRPGAASGSASGRKRQPGRRPPGPAAGGIKGTERIEHDEARGTRRSGAEDDARGGAAGAPPAEPPEAPELPTSSNWREALPEEELLPGDLGEGVEDIDAVSMQTARAVRRVPVTFSSVVLLLTLTIGVGMAARTARRPVAVDPRRPRDGRIGPAAERYDPPHPAEPDLARAQHHLPRAEGEPDRSER